MKRLLLLILFGVALWYGWQHRDDLLHRQQGHEAVIENTSGRELTRVRLSVGGQSFVKESIPDGERAVFPFRVDSDATFNLVWSFAGSANERSWSGGMVPRGPMLQRHVMIVDPDGEILYRPENK
jgi:hypothetical protein